MNIPEFSVAMCTFNGEKYLPEQLRSIAAQTTLPAELVIGDDGSSDRTISIIHEFAQVAPFPIRLQVNKQTIGVANNFFQTIRRCQLEWVILCDQDDVWLNDRMAIFQNSVMKHPEMQMILTNGELTDFNLKPLRQSLFSAYRLNNSEIDMINNGQGAKILVRHPFATGAAMAVRRDFAAALPNPDFGFLHDEWIAWFACPSIYVVDRLTFQYRQHPKQQTGVDGRVLSQLKRFANPKPGLSMTLDQGIYRYKGLLASMTHLKDKSEKQLVMDTLREKIDFIEWRSGLPDRIMARALHIISRGRIRNYFRYAAGSRTIIKDLLFTNRL